MRHIFQALARIVRNRTWERECQNDGSGSSVTSVVFPVTLVSRNRKIIGVRMFVLDLSQVWSGRVSHSLQESPLSCTGATTAGKFALASLEMERVVPVNVPISVDQLSNTPVRGGLLSEWWCFDCMLHLAFFFTELFENVAFLMVVALSEEPPTLLPWLRPTLLMPTPPQLVMLETKLFSVFDRILSCFPKLFLLMWFLVLLLSS